jgi:myo-inositol-1(or 4)-monophosphatase
MSEGPHHSLPGPSELELMVEFACEVAREAGRIQMQSLGKGAAIEKKGPRELVTEVDKNCERHVYARVRGRFPDHDYYGEEGTRREEHQSPWRWIVDPLDGTTNYAHQIPLFSVSIGIERAGECVGGVVYAPYLNELFFGWKGGGAYLNSRSIRLHVSETRALSEAVLATGFAYVQNQTPNNNHANWARLSLATRGLRRMGSAALDLAYVAAGRFDGFWEMHLMPYDVAAGVVLIKEAGGRVTDLFKGEDWLFGRTFLGSNGHVHDAIHALLDPVKPDGHVRLPPG